MTPSGDVITLEDQDRSRWKRTEIDQANTVLDAAVARNAIGPYQVQALIAACHANARHAGATDWPRIADLYDRLLEVTANPLVKLNHAVAVGMATGPEDALALVGQLEASGDLRDYHLLHATRADFLRRVGRNSEAADAYRDSSRSGAHRARASLPDQTPTGTRQRSSTSAHRRHIGRHTDQGHSALLPPLRAESDSLA